MGVEKQIIRPGTGPKPAPGQTVKQSTVLDSGKVVIYPSSSGVQRTLAKNLSPSKIGKGAVIKGWDEGVMGMKIGEVARLRCSPDYAYGAGGFPAWGIQPNSVLDFEIEVLSVQ